MGGGGKKLIVGLLLTAGAGVQINLSFRRREYPRGYWLGGVQPATEGGKTPHWGGSVYIPASTTPPPLPTSGDLQSAGVSAQADGGRGGGHFCCRLSTGPGPQGGRDLVGCHCSHFIFGHYCAACVGVEYIELRLV